MNVKYISKTANPDFSDVESYLIWVARVSSPNQENPEYSKLLKYCINHGHWSVFEMADMTVEIETTLAITPQFLRHRSFSFQQFSGRYAPFSYYEDPELRMQGDTKQGSGDAVDAEDFKDTGEEIIEACFDFYDQLLLNGFSRETARAYLPACTQTRFYMKGSVRSWIHYLKVRLDNHTQKEHREIAEKILEVFKEQFPVTAQAMGWSK